MPKMSKEVFEELMEAKSLAGTFQSNILDLLRDGDGALARWIKKMRELLPKGSYINDFMNLNSGLCEESGWHRDRPTEGTTITPQKERPSVREVSLASEPREPADLPADSATLKHSALHEILRVTRTILPRARAW